MNLIISKKAQLSAFIIIAVLILFMFGMGTFIYKMLGASFEDKVDKAVERTKQKASENYISVCLKDSTEKAVKWIAKSGGYARMIEKPYTGTAYTPLSIALSNEGLPPAPEYPTDMFSIYQDTPFAFGKKYLPFLCQPGGPNDVHVTEYAKRCPAGAYGPKSIQQEMALFVAVGLKECFNPASLDMSGEFEVELEDPNALPVVSITLGEEGMLAKASYPFIFKKDDKSITRSVDFTYEIPIRLKKIYGLADYMIRNDLYYIDFNISKDFMTETKRSKDYDEAMTIIIEEDFDGNKTDIIHIIDNRSVLDGKAVDFRFARENRPPVLERIKLSTIKEPAGDQLEYDIAVKANDVVKFKIDSLDPDEDQLYFALAGWRMQYNATLTPASLFSCTATNGVLCTLQNAKWGWQEKLTRPKYGSSDIISGVHELNKNTVQIGTGIHDLGGHSMIVIVSDDKAKLEELYDKVNDTLLGGGSQPLIDLMGAFNDYNHLIDYQIVNVLVFIDEDLVADPGEGCYYEPATLCDGIISKEDPLVVDGSGSIISNYVWTLQQSTSFVEFIVDTAVAVLPFDDPDHVDVTILDIVDVFGLTSGSVAHLSLEDESISPMVVDCIAYKADEYLTYPPWPYNITKDPYYAAHACCSGNDVITTPNIECFNDVWVGPIYSFDKDKYTRLVGTTDYKITWENLPQGKNIPDSDGWADFSISDVPDDLLNDVYERKVVRYCDGDRGNICIGPIKETITWLESCTGDLDSNLDEVCSGAKVSPGPYNAGCENYQPSTTYESKYDELEFWDISPASGSCKHIPQHGTGDGGSFDPSAPWECESGCNGAGACTVPANCICDKGNNCDGLEYENIKGKAIVKYNGIYCDTNCNVVEGEGYDSNAAACVAEYGGAAWNPARPQERRCCGNNDGKAKIVDSACCTKDNGCAVGAECVEHNNALTKSQGSASQVSYLCYLGNKYDCRLVDECEVKILPAQNWWCARDGWEKLSGSSSDGKLCGMEPPDLAPAYCGKCNNQECEPYNSMCPPTMPICIDPNTMYPFYQAICMS